MYAIVKTGGKQYRVEPGRWLLIERLPEAEGAEVSLHPLLVVDGDELLDGDALDGVTVRATILAHERGPKLRVVKFKPKRGYKRRNGHRQELTRVQVTGIDRGGAASQVAAKSAPTPAAATASTSASTSSEDSDGS